MKLFEIQRKTKSEERYAPQMGALTTKVTYIRKAFLRMPYKTLHSYRETYYGEVKECSKCSLAS